MAKDSIDKTTFVTECGLYSWNYMPFGFKCASNTFQRVATMILEPYSMFASCYIDDICVRSNMFEEHLFHVNDVLQAFYNAGMTLHLKKCVFCTT